VAALAGVAPECEVLDSSTPGGAVYPYDFADPDVIEAGATFYGYGTNSATGNVQIIESDDLVHWTPLGDALPTLGSWAKPGYTWAPSVIAADGGYLLFYTAEDASSQQQCISVAFSSSPAGPFVDNRGNPLICQGNLDGAIDASPYEDGAGNLYLTWKSIGGDDPPTIWSAQLDPTGQSLLTSPTVLLEPSRYWEDGIVEGPDMVQVDGRYLLFFSGNNWQTSEYGTGVATCDGPLGPCQAVGGPILSTTSIYAGPGGPTVFQDNSGQWWIGFHAWQPDSVGYPNPRLLFIRKLNLSATGISVGGPPG
jgi:beta-xylosidase